MTGPTRKGKTIAGTPKSSSPTGSLKLPKDISNMSKDSQQIYHYITKYFDNKLAQVNTKLDEKTKKIGELESTVGNLKNQVGQLQDVVNGLNGINDMKINIDKMVQKFEQVEEMADTKQAQERRDTLILSGSIPEATASENCHAIVRQKLMEETGINISDEEISTAHRIGKKPENSPDKRSILFKVSGTEVKSRIMAACREKKPRLYVNESLTPTRSTIMYVLRKAKREHSQAFGYCRAQDGNVYVFLPTTAQEGYGARQRYRRITVNTRTSLDNLLSKQISKTSGDYVNDWS